MDKIKIQSIEVSHKGEYFSLTDIAKSTGRKPAHVIRTWLRNSRTILFLEAWEEIHNPNFKVANFGHFKIDSMNQAIEITTKRYIEITNAIGIESKAGRYGGTFAHVEIALDFAAWVNPVFKAYLFKEWVRMKETEQQRQGIEFFLQKSINNIDETSNLLRELQTIIEGKNKLKP